MVNAKVTLSCDWCGKKIDRYPSQLKGKEHHFCSRTCLWNYSNKSKNPDEYANLRNLKPVSKHMSRLNREINSSRMTAETREKIRNARLDTGHGKTYSKLYGRHEHRVVAEQILGRSLLPGEVVHHLDFNPRNNAPDNLIIFSSQADHAKYHAALNTFFNKGLLPEKGVMPDEVRAT